MAAAMIREWTPAPLIIHNVLKLDADGVQADFWVLANGGVIERTGTGEEWTRYADGATTVDGAGAYLTPGFIDIHFHGGGGHSNEDGPAAIQAAAAAHRAHGTTRAVVSLVANPLGDLLSSVASIADLTSVDPYILGSHLEGPYLSSERTGAHNPNHLIDPTPDDVQNIIRAGRGTLRQITIDPSRRTALGAIESFTLAGVTVAIGHTNADYELTLKALESGARLITHAFNAMPGIDHREPGPIVAALDTPGTFFELILDGKHVNPRVAALLMSAAPHQVALITDAMAAACSGDGEYKLGTLDVVVDQGTARLSGTTTLAGSTLTLETALQIGLQSGIDRIALVEALTLTPARILRLDSHLGLLRPGFLADMLLLDSDWKIRDVYLGGQIPSSMDGRKPESGADLSALIDPCAAPGDARTSPGV
jgi:N-acetylglucosamine-6-phosphate deacetylase